MMLVLLGNWEVRQTNRGRAWALRALLLLGLLLWTAGALDLFSEWPLLSLLALLWGGVQAAVAGFLLLATRWSGRLEHGHREAIWFCATLGIGAAFIGLAISPLAGWLLPALLFAAGGLALMAWAPQALGRRRERGG